MVLVERNTENMRNGRRSRGPSPNGQGGSPDSSSDEDSTKKTGKSSKTKSEYEEKIRVGRDYQVQCPEYIPMPTGSKPETLPDRALLVWSPTKDIPESKLEDYIAVAKERYGYNGEQALGMLFWHKHDLARAVHDLSNFTPFPDEWSSEDKVLFEQAFQFHGKSFHRIRQMLPDKSIASLVKYYYSWKKTRSRSSVMDRQEKLKTKEAGSGNGGTGGSENGSENGSNDDSDGEDKKWSMHRGIRRSSGGPHGTAALAGPDDHHRTGPNHVTPGLQQPAPFIGPASVVAALAAAAAAAKLAMLPADGAGAVLGTVCMCVGCGVACSIVNQSPHGALCASCFHHWRRTGALRPTSGPLQGRRCRSNGQERFKRKPPRGMYINHDDIVSLATQDDDQAAAASTAADTGAAATSVNGLATVAPVSKFRLDDPLNVLDRKLAAMLSTIQANKQTISLLRKRKQTATAAAAMAAASSSGGSADLLTPELVALRPNEASTRINARWNTEEHMLAIEGIRRFGKDFTAIAELIGTKTEQHLRTFFVNYRKRYNLDNLLKDFDARRQRQQDQMQQMAANSIASVLHDSDEDMIVMESEMDQF